MTLKDITEAFQWITKNGKRKLTKEEKEWMKKSIDEAETVNDLMNVAIKFTQM